MTHWRALWRGITPWVLVVVALTGCGPDRSSAPSDGPVVFATIQPLAFVVERLAGPEILVETLLAPGQEPHTFEPSPRQMAALAKARACFIVGTLSFERRLAQKLDAGQAALAIINTSSGAELRPMDPEDHDGHVEHADHAGIDPHVWLGPPQLAALAASVAEGLSEVEPARAETYAANLQRFQEELKTVDQRVSELLAPCKGRAVFVFHPAFGYFTDAYGLVQEAVETGGKSPTPRQLQALVGAAKAHGVKVIFVQPQFDPKSAEAIAQAIGGRVTPLDPLAKDVLANIGLMATQIREATLPNPQETASP